MTTAARGLRLARAALLTALAGCASAADLGGGIAALEIRGPAPPTLTVGATVRLTAQALDGRGDPVAAEFAWRTPDPERIRVDVATGDVTGLAAGTARVQVSAGDAVSGFFTLSVVPAPVTP